MSDDRKHDSAFALAAMRLITDECMKLTADRKNDITIISDGAACQKFYELRPFEKNANFHFQKNDFTM